MPLPQDVRLVRSSDRYDRRDQKRDLCIRHEHGGTVFGRFELTRGVKQPIQLLALQPHAVIVHRNQGAGMRSGVGEYARTRDPHSRIDVLAQAVHCAVLQREVQMTRSAGGSTIDAPRKLRRVEPRRI